MNENEYSRNFVLFPGCWSWNKQEKRLGPDCKIVMTPEWNLMIDCGIEFVPWPEKKGVNLKNYEFNAEYEKRMVEAIVDDDSLRAKFKNWSRGPALDFIFRWARAKNFPLRQVDEIILTHSHADHIGALPFALKWLKGKIWGLPHTLGIVPLSLADSFNLSRYLFEPEKSLKNEEEIKKYLVERKKALHFQIRNILRKRKKLYIGENNQITPQGIFVGNAGHIAGAAYLAIRMPNGKIVGVTGDISWHNQPMVKGSKLPDDLPDEWLFDYLIGTDFTYPEVKKTTFEEDLESFVKRVKGLVNQRKVVVIATYANAKMIGIGSELSKRLNIPIYLDGMGVKILRVYLKNKAVNTEIYPPLNLKNIRTIKNRNQREEFIRNLHRGKTAIIITTSAYGEGGPIKEYQKTGLGNPRFYFFSLGWNPEDSFWNKTKDKIRNDPLSPSVIWEDYDEIRVLPVRGRVERHYLSSHTDLNDFIVFLEKLIKRKKKPLEKLFITHCIEEKREELRETLRDFAKEILIPSKRNFCFRL